MVFVKIEKAGSIFVFLYSDSQSFLLICFLNSAMFFITVISSLNVYFRSSTYPWV